MEKEYDYRVAVYFCEGYSIFYRLKKETNGECVPVGWLSLSAKGSCSWWDINRAMNGIEWGRRQGEPEEKMPPINVYHRIIERVPYTKDEFKSEAHFWKRMTCLHFYVKLGEGYTITVWKKSRWRKNRFNGYIKRIHIPNNYSQQEFHDVVTELLKEAENYGKRPWCTPTGIEEFRKDESIGKHKFPWIISVYKGEKRLLMIPYLDHVEGFRVQPDQMVVLDENADVLEIGNGLLDTVQIIKTSPRLIGPAQGYRLATKYKGWKTFSKRNLLVSVTIGDDFSYRLNPEKCFKGDGIYCDAGEERRLDASATAEEIGSVIKELFREIEVNYGGKQTYDPYPKKDVELLDGSVLTVKHPCDRHFQDREDYGVGELYQCYFYYPKEDSDYTAFFFLGIAPEIDCDLEPENIRSSWERVYGQAENFEIREEACGIFGLRVEMRNKSCHKISYLLTMAEDLILECGMEVKQPNRRKKLDESLIGLFGEFVLNCKMK